MSVSTFLLMYTFEDVNLRDVENGMLWNVKMGTGPAWCRKCSGNTWFLTQLKQYVKYSKRKFKDDFTFQ